MFRSISLLAGDSRARVRRKDPSSSGHHTPLRLRPKASSIKEQGTRRASPAPPKAAPAKEPRRAKAPDAKGASPCPPGPRGPPAPEDGKPKGTPGTPGAPGATKAPGAQGASKAPGLPGVPKGKPARGKSPGRAKGLSVDDPGRFFSFWTLSSSGSSELEESPASQRQGQPRAPSQPCPEGHMLESLGAQRRLPRGRSASLGGEKVIHVGKESEQEGVATPAALGRMQEAPPRLEAQPGEARQERQERQASLRRTTTAPGPQNALSPRLKDIAERVTSLGRAASEGHVIVAAQEEIEVLREKLRTLEAAVAMMERRLKAKAEASASLLCEMRAGRDALWQQLQAKEEEMRGLAQRTGLLPSPRRAGEDTAEERRHTALLRALSQKTSRRVEQFVEEDFLVTSKIWDEFLTEHTAQMAGDSRSSGGSQGVGESSGRRHHARSLSLCDEGANGEAQAEESRELQEQLQVLASENAVLREKFQELGAAVEEEVAAVRGSMARREEKSRQREQELCALRGEKEVLEQELLRYTQEHQALVEELQMGEVGEALEHHLSCLEVENEALRRQLRGIMERQGDTFPKSSHEADSVGAPRSRTVNSTDHQKPSSQYARSLSVELPGGRGKENEKNQGKILVLELECGRLRLELEDKEGLVLSLRKEIELLRQEVEAPGGSGVCRRRSLSLGELSQRSSEEDGKPAAGLSFQETQGLEEKVLGLQARCRSLSEQLSEAKGQFRKELDAAVLESEALREQMEKEAAAAAWEIEKLREEKASLEDQLRHETLRSGFRMDALHEEQADVEDEVREEIAGLNTQVQELESERVRLLEQLRNESAAAALRAAALKEANSRLEEQLEREEAASAHEIVTLKTQKEGLESELKGLLARVEAQCAQIETAQKSAEEEHQEELAALRVQVRVLKVEKLLLAEKVQKMASYDEGDSPRSEDMREGDGLRRDLAEAGMELKALQETSEVLHAQIGELLQENALLRGKFASSSALHVEGPIRSSSSD